METMTAPVDLPAETQRRVLEYLSDTKQTAWQMCNSFRSIRLVNRAWCASANELLFRYALLRAERNLTGEVNRITEFNEMSKTGLSDHIRVLEVFISPRLYNYCRSYRTGWTINGREFSPTTNAMDCLIKYLPECVPRLRNLEVVEFSFPESIRYRTYGHDGPNFPFAARLEYYEAICKSLSMAPMPKLNSLRLDVAEFRDLAIFFKMQSPSIDSGENDTTNNSDDNNRQENAQPNYLADNFSRIRDLYITVKEDYQNSHYDIFNGMDQRMSDSEPSAWSSLSNFFKIEFKSLEHLEIDVPFFQDFYSLNEKLFEPSNITNLRCLSLQGINFTSDSILRVMDAYNASLEEVHFSLPPYLNRRKSQWRKYMEDIETKLASMPNAKMACIYGPWKEKWTTIVNPRIDD